MAPFYNRNSRTVLYFVGTVRLASSGSPGSTLNLERPPAGASSMAKGTRCVAFPKKRMETNLEPTARGFWKILSLPVEGHEVPETVRSL